MWTRITKLRYIKFLLCKFHSKITIFSWICYWNTLVQHDVASLSWTHTIYKLYQHTFLLMYVYAKKSTSTTCTSLILWLTDHYFGSTKLCCLTFRDQCIFINLLMQKNLVVLMQKKRLLIFSKKQKAGIILSAEGVFIANVS